MDDQRGCWESILDSIKGVNAIRTIKIRKQTSNKDLMTKYFNNVHNQIKAIEFKQNRNKGAGS